AASRDAAHSTAWQLADANRDRNRAIDARSRELIAQGFTFDGHQFSLSDHAQRNWMDLIVNGLVTDPQPISTITDDVYMLASEDLAAIYAAGRTQVVTVLGSGQQLKAAVNACETVAEAADPGEEIEIELDLSDYAGDALTVDVRHFRDHVENTGSQPRRLLLDADGNSDDEIRGRAILLTPEVRAGGIVRIRWRWDPSRDGLQPDLFKLQRTAGPTSPADVTTSNVGRGVYELDTPALSDSSAYTYQLIAQNTAGTVTATLLSGISITADATGPTAPGSLTIEAV
ncbi:Uncharacterized protein SCF082_LOCUS52102, partial [Durusdinium trenchii]